MPYYFYISLNTMNEQMNGCMIIQTMHHTNLSLTLLFYLSFEPLIVHGSPALSWTFSHRVAFSRTLVAVGGSHRLV